MSCIEVFEGKEKNVELDMETENLESIFSAISEMRERERDV